MTGEITSRRISPSALAAPATGIVLVLFVLPLLAVIVAGLTASDGSDITLAHYRQIATDPAYAAALLRSLQDTVVVTLIALVLAFPFAWVLAEWLPRWLQPLALLLVALPALASVAARAYAWRLTLAQDGLVSTALVDAGFLAAPLQLVGTRAVMMVALTHFATVLMTLAIFVALRRLTPDARRAAADLGAGPLAHLRHLVLPLAWPGIAAGTFLTFAATFGDQVTPKLLGSPQQPVLTDLVAGGIGSGNLPMAAALTTGMAAIMALVWLGCTALLSVARR